MSQTLIVVDVQNGFINEFTRHIPGRIATLIAEGKFDEIYYTRFVNIEGSAFRRLLGWEECEGPPDTELAPELHALAPEDRIFTKPGYAGLPDNLREALTDRKLDEVHVVGIDTDMCVLKVAMDLFDINIRPYIFTDCCASTSGLQSHLAGLAVLARNIGADHLRDAGLGEGRLAAP